MNDKMILSQCHFNCRIGCTAEERATTQTIIFDIELWFDNKPSAKTDNLVDAIDYCTVHETVKALVEGREFNLIETMIESVAEILLKSFPVNRVSLRLKKPGPMQQRGGAWVGIEITRP